MTKWKTVWSKCRQALLAGLVLFALQSAAISASAADIHPKVAADARGGTLTSVLLVMKRQADLSAAGQFPTKAQKGAFVYRTLRALADSSQSSVLARVRARGLQAQSFWIMNAIVVTAPARRSISTGDVQALAAIDDIARLQPTDVGLIKPVASGPVAPPPDGPLPNIQAIGAPEVWRSGHRGEGIVVGSIDTGVALVPDLASKYRGYTGPGGATNNDYNWFDAITHCSGPCDGNLHGTHTTGTMVGSHDKTEIGVAPGAQWIACRALNDGGSGTWETVLKCMQFMLAPTKRDGTGADPGKAADVVNSSLGGGTSTTLNPALNSLYAAGIMMVAANGNSGGTCGNAGYPANFSKVLAVGATTQNGNLPPAAGSDAIATFSSRGPGPTGVKPDLVAPGVDIVSVNNVGGYIAIQGTSMASPHVAGAVALLWSARPDLRGNITATYNALTSTADRLAGGCGGSVPNNTYGYGFIQVQKAVKAARTSP